MKKIIALFVLCQLILSIINAQIPSTFFENKDAFKSFSYLKKESKTMPAKKMQPVDAARLRAEDDRPRSGDVPFRFGEAFDVNYTLKDGAWEKADTAMVWSLKISSPGAYSLNFIFDRLTLSEGAQLYIFSLDGTMVYGPVTSKQNLPEDGTFLTDLVAGDEAVIQLFEPYHAKVRSTLSISRVVHAYVNLFPSFATRGVSSSGNCNKDIVCFSEWYNESEAVALVLLANGTEHCSGSLLNNTVQDYRPFFLTAFHCIDSDQNGALSDAEISGSENWAFRFRFKKTSCNGNYVTSYITYNRADFRAAWNGTDFALMELRSFIRENNRHTFLG